MCRLFKVSGRVQGVFFRANTRKVAQSLDVRGHAVNLADGSVEVRACGDDGAVAKLEAWLHDGPPQAAVTSVDELPAECTSPGRFRTG